MSRALLPARRRIGPLLSAMVMVASVAVPSAQPAYLSDDDLRNLLSDHTLIGRDWAEYYTKDGIIQGRARYFGIAGNYQGRWTVSGNRVCYDYPSNDRDTCSMLTRQGDEVQHFDLTGRPKIDGVARRLEGNRVSSLQ